jgi:glycosyltransferase involved in cell wall biosynthesis
MIKALWLTSWYPTDLDKWNGDFIQRHAHAAALFCNITVIHVEADSQGLLQELVVKQTSVNGNLTETIVLFKPARLKIAGRFLTFQRYTKYFKKLVAEYIEENGLPDIVHVHVAMKAGIIALWVKNKFKVPYVVTEHWTIYQNDSEDAYVYRNPVFKKYTRNIFKNAALVLPVSENLGQLISRFVTPVSYRRVFNVVDTTHFRYDGFREERPFTFIHVSSLNEQKNPDAIIESFVSFHQTYPRSKLIMVGEVQGDLFQNIIQQHLSENAIEFTGLVSYPGVAHLMRNSDAFVLFSRYENMPCVVLEALCCGLPVISSDVGGLREVINKENGTLVSNYTVAALTEAMLSLYMSYLQFNRQKISSDARSKFSYELIGEHIEKLYRDVLNNTSEK